MVCIRDNEVDAIDTGDAEAESPGCVLEKVLQVIFGLFPPQLDHPILLDDDKSLCGVSFAKYESLFCKYKN